MKLGARGSSISNKNRTRNSPIQLGFSSGNYFVAFLIKVPEEGHLVPKRLYEVSPNYTVGPSKVSLQQIPAIY